MQLKFKKKKKRKGDCGDFTALKKVETERKARLRCAVYYH